MRKALDKAGYLRSSGTNLYEVMAGKRNTMNRATANRVHELYRQTFGFSQATPFPTVTVANIPNGDTI